MKRILTTLLFLLYLVSPSWAIVPIHLEWDAVADATGYVVSSRTTEGLYTNHSQTTSTDQVIYVDESAPVFLTIRTISSAGNSNYATELECKFITTSIKGQGTIDWNAIQAVESGDNHILTPTPATGWRLSAIRVDDELISPFAATHTFTSVSTNHDVEVIFQKIITMYP